MAIDLASEGFNVVHRSYDSTDSIMLAYSGSNAFQLRTECLRNVLHSNNGAKLRSTEQNWLLD